MGGIMLKLREGWELIEQVDAADPDECDEVRSPDGVLLCEHYGISGDVYMSHDGACSLVGKGSTNWTQIAHLSFLAAGLESPWEAV
jgi:hypothetical protein